MPNKILITGATGFIGSNLAELFVKKGFNVIAYDRYNSNNDWGWLEHSQYNKDMEIILGDVRDYDSVFKVVSNCNIVIHLAALIGIPYSYISPLAYIRTNIEGTYNILESSKTKGLDQVIITSTSETYGSAQYTPIDEKHPLSAQSPYASTKIAADQLSLSYFRSFDSPVKIIRPFNTYGPRQSTRAIIPTIISQCLNDEKYIKIGNLKPTRDLTYVEDICSAYVEILKNNNFFGEVINIGSKNEISIQNILNQVMKNMNIDKKIIVDSNRVRPDKSEVKQLVCNNQKLLKNTSWKPRVIFEDGINRTIEWFKKNYVSKNKNIYTI